MFPSWSIILTSSGLITAGEPVIGSEQASHSKIDLNSISKYQPATSSLKASTKSVKVAFELTSISSEKSNCLK